jgi:hypothetical protein
MQRYDLDYEQAFELGREDRRKHRAYWDGTSPSHNLALVIPGCAFTSPAKRGYRDGWVTES